MKCQSELSREKLISSLARENNMLSSDVKRSPLLWLKYSSTLEDKFRFSARPCNILYVFLFKTEH